MDSGFFMLKGLIVIYEIGVYGSAVVKKRRYWTSVMYGDQINTNFEKK